MDRRAVLPPVVRARDFHIYTRDGARLVDMYLLGGRALLGHRPRNLARELSSALSRGLFGDYPSIYTARAQKLVEKERAALGGSGRQARIFRNVDRALQAAARFLGVGVEHLQPEDGALPARFSTGSRVDSGAAGRGADTRGADAAEASARPGRLLCYRPFAADQTRPGAADIIMPVIPFPGEWAFSLLYFSPHADPGVPIPDSDPVSGAILAGTLRALHNLLALSAWPGKALPPSFFSPLWVTNGPYLYPTCSRDDYAALHARFLEAGILLHPEYPGPSIVPIMWSEGERELFHRTSTAMSKELSGGER